MDDTKTTNKRVVRCLVCKAAISPGAGVWWPRFKRFLCQEHRGIIVSWKPKRDGAALDAAGVGDE